MRQDLDNQNTPNQKFTNTYMRNFPMLTKKTLTTLIATNIHQLTNVVSKISAQLA